MDLFVVPTVGFDLLYAFVIVRIDRRDLRLDQRHTPSDRENGLHAKSPKHSRGTKLRAT